MKSRESRHKGCLKRDAVIVKRRASSKRSIKVIGVDGLEALGKEGRGEIPSSPEGSKAQFAEKWRAEKVTTQHYRTI